jgi:hypothetical protein
LDQRLRPGPDRLCCDPAGCPVLGREHLDATDRVNRPDTWTAEALMIERTEARDGAGGTLCNRGYSQRAMKRRPRGLPRTTARRRGPGCQGAREREQREDETARKGRHDSITPAARSGFPLRARLSLTPPSYVKVVCRVGLT